MGLIAENIMEKLSVLKRYVPYGTFDSWDDLDPKLYHAVHIFWLRFYGLWYYDFSPKKFSSWLRLIYTLVVLWLVCFLPGIGEVEYLLRQGGNVGNIAEGLYLFLSEMYTYFKIAVFWLNKEKILNLLKYLHRVEFRPEEQEHREILRRSIQTARFVMTYYSSMCVGAVSVGIIMPLTENLDILPTNVEYTSFDVYKAPAYGIIYLHHIYYKPATCIIDGVMDTILAAFISSAIGQIEILAFNLRNFKMLAKRRRERDQREKKVVGEDEEYIHLVLKKCMIHYNAIIRYVAIIESAFSLASALQFMLSVMVLCLVGVQFLSIENPASHPMQIVWMAIYLTCMLIEVFILCWFGNELILKSLELREAAYEGTWLDLDSKTAMYLVIFLERAKNPLRVTAGKIFTLSLETYTYIINWSYKAFAVMSNVKK
ncbi:odorant receptor 46a-like [Aricia agestis]|uniref:odorant receptor 46a-like n=1 Tax=Aricia agestis TaxID=91739 RepID=UPI001C20372E|nr:odorant receptor 46a-like [Aricia agestis]